MSVLEEFREALRMALADRPLAGTAVEAGLPRDAIRSVLVGHDPRLSRAVELADALGLEFYVGPPRAAARTRPTERRRGQPMTEAPKEIGAWYTHPDDPENKGERWESWINPELNAPRGTRYVRGDIADEHKRNAEQYLEILRWIGVEQVKNVVDRRLQREIADRESLRETLEAAWDTLASAGEGIRE